MKQLLKKLNAGLMALLTLAAAAIVPANSALAYVPPIIGNGTGNNTKAYCQLLPSGKYQIHTDNASDPTPPDSSTLTYLFEYKGSKNDLVAQIEASYSSVQNFCVQAIQAQSTYAVSAQPCTVGGTNTPIVVNITNTADKSGLTASYTVTIKSLDGTYTYTDKPVVADGETKQLTYSQPLAYGEYKVSITATDGTSLVAQNVTVAACTVPPAIAKIDLPKPAVNDPCGGIYNASWVKPADTTTIKWEITGDKHLIATIIAPNTTFTDGTMTHDYGLTPDTLTECTVPPLPNMPPAGDCEFAAYGRTIRPSTTVDVSDRDKYGEGGEINADGWGTTFRLYAATKEALNNVTLTYAAAQGMTFKPGSINTISSPGAGALKDNGYTNAVTYTAAPEISADGKTVTFHIDHMPAMSSISFNVTFIPDDSGNAFVIDSSMVGEKTECPVEPAVAPMFDDMSCELNDKLSYTIPEHDDMTVYTVQVGDGEEEIAEPGTHPLLRLNQTVTIRAYTENALGDILQSGEWVHVFTIPVCPIGVGSVKPQVVPAIAKAPAVQELPTTGPSDNSHLTVLGMVLSLATYAAVLRLQRRSA